MCIVAFITEPQVIDRILDHFRRTAAARCRSPDVSPHHHLGVSRCASASGSLGSGAADVRTFGWWS